MKRGLFLSIFVAYAVILTLLAYLVLQMDEIEQTLKYQLTVVYLLLLVGGLFLPNALTHNSDLNPAEFKLTEESGVNHDDVYRDVNAEEAGIKKEHDFQQVLQVVTQVGNLGTFSYNLNTDEIEFNAMFAEIYGLESQEKTSSAPLLELVHPQDRAAVLKALDDIQKNSVISQIRYRIVTAKDELRYLQVNHLFNRKTQVMICCGQVKVATSLEQFFE